MLVDHSFEITFVSAAPPSYSLTNSPLVPHICVSEASQHWFRKWLVACPASSHYLNQYQAIANWTVTNKLQWIINENINLFIHKMHLKIPSAKWWPSYLGGDGLTCLWVATWHVHILRIPGTTCQAVNQFWCHSRVGGPKRPSVHYNDTIMSAMASQISCLTIVYSTVYSRADQRKHPSSASVVFVRGIHRWSVNSPKKWPVAGKMLNFHSMTSSWVTWILQWSHLSLKAFPFTSHSFFSTVCSS